MTALVAAADIANGAMIALVPSDVDARRLAVEGGEPLDQLHLTLLYLGDADRLDDTERQALRDWAAGAVDGWDSIEAEAFAPSLFNPTGPEPCAVMLCSGPDLAEFYETTIADVTEFVDLPPDMHLPYIPHITLKYADMLKPDYEMVKIEELSSRTGPVVFDRLRLAIGGEVLDVPFQTPVIPVAAVDASQAELPLARDEPAPSVVASGREAFDGCLRCYGPAHDGQCPPAL